MFRETKVFRVVERFEIQILKIYKNKIIKNKIPAGLVEVSSLNNDLFSTNNGRNKINICVYGKHLKKCFPILFTTTFLLFYISIVAYKAAIYVLTAEFRVFNTKEK